MFDVVTYWKPSPKFPEAVVRKWYANVRKHTPETSRVIVLTDSKICDIPTEPVGLDLPVWWGKLGLFARQTPMLYLDLDTRVTKPLPSEMDTLTSPLIMLQDDRYPHIRGSGVLWVRPSLEPCKSILTEFLKRPGEIMMEYRNDLNKFGDQGWIADVARSQGYDIPVWQRIFPGEFYCATPDTVKEEFAGQTFVYLSGEVHTLRLDHPGAAWNK
jgi:hypothetical protein